MKHKWIILLSAILLVGAAGATPVPPEINFDSLTANPASLPPDGSSNSTIIATISGSPLQNNVIYFQIKSGSGNLTTPYQDLNGYFNITDSSGKAYANLQAPSTPGNTTVRAWTQAGLLTREVTVQFISIQPHPRYDVNGDGVVNVLDLVAVGQHFGETTSQPYPNYDVNMDGTVNVLDLVAVGQHFGETV